MHSPFREMLERMWIWLVGHVGPVAMNAKRRRDSGPSMRARFWTELREGQREAAAHRAKLR